MKTIERRLQAIEQARQVGNKEVVLTSDGSEFGLEPVEGGWAIFMHGGKPIKALPQTLWDAWN